jgi:hypothetical protein
MKVKGMVHTTYHRGLLRFWLSKQQHAFGPASQRLLEYFTDKLTKFYFHISWGSYYKQCLFKETVWCAHLLVITFSTHYLGHQAPMLPNSAMARIGHLQCKSCWRPTNNLINNPVNVRSITITVKKHERLATCLWRWSLFLMFVWKYSLLLPAKFINANI